MIKTQKLLCGIGGIFAVCLPINAETDSHEICEQSGLYLIVFSKYEPNRRSLYLSNENGSKLQKLNNLNEINGYPAVSPNQKQIAFYAKYDRQQTWSIHVMDIDGSQQKRLTTAKYRWDSAPAWSPDGKTIAFAREYADQSGKWQEEIWLMDSDGKNQRKIQALSGRAPEFMTDGRILFQSKASPSQISIANVDGTGVSKLTSDDSNNMSPKISPDGSQIAYLSNRDGNQEVYIMDVDGSNNVRITTNIIQEWDPAWSSDGNKVLFSSDNVHGYHDIFEANNDGSEKKRIVPNGSQVATIKCAKKTANLN